MQINFVNEKGELIAATDADRLPQSGEKLEVTSRVGNRFKHGKYVVSGPPSSVVDVRFEDRLHLVTLLVLKPE